MQISKIQKTNYNSQFTGIVKLRNLKKKRKAVEVFTPPELDKGLAELSLKNLFDGQWTNDGNKNVKYSKLAQYLDVIQVTLGINVPRSIKELEHIKLKSLNDRYSIEMDNGYLLTHIRDDQFIWD